MPGAELLLATALLRLLPALPLPALLPLRAVLSALLLPVLSALLLRACAAAPLRRVAAMIILNVALLLPVAIHCLFPLPDVVHPADAWCRTFVKRSREPIPRDGRS
ncbi:MAG TPA: hypothetical protein VN858_03755 [Casimicrobiaceae bacterium]|nr:hypothetical protein [Casimicrobiaceae bacterium]HXU66486.1 hypothetical protein [Casimicrobiaceae bacterium]